MILGSISNLLCLVFLVVGVRRELSGCCVVENQCVGRHVDSKEQPSTAGGRVHTVAAVVLAVHDDSNDH